ncbi:M20/M25/M40 family metallo-hydrolase [Ammonifex thiophilus]|uniref:M20/M25/M40 family metallo-hydrolase n=1 Tax=Ammonifex thiophilus TaxID=444093 RepID=A0A3D8P4M0_9THEO|nr:M20/M25/M40 family metallo-hydrolase [Ammonifex thiophilus]RDV82509.1 M20/M25/M40 family metallo-hydrolase [Ammonifex thiophilus]
MWQCKELLKLLVKAASCDPARGALAPLVFALESAALPWRPEPVDEEVINILIPLSSAPRVLVAAHYDVVPPVIEGVRAREGEESECLYGRGACDVLGGVAALLGALAELGKDFPWEKSGLWVAFTGDEEREGRGSRGLSASLPSSLRYALVLEPTRGELAFSSCGSLEYEVEIRGTPSHGSVPERGKNPLLWAARFLLRLEETLEALNRRYSPPLPLAVTPLLLAGGSEELSVPVAARLRFDLRLPPDVPLREVEEELAGLLQAEEGITLHCGLAEEWAASWESDPESDFGRLLREVYREIYGREPVPVVMESWTDAHHFRSRGLETVVWGPGDLAVAHTPFEHLHYRELEEAKEFLKLFFRRLLDL